MISAAFLTAIAEEKPLNIPPLPTSMLGRSRDEGRSNKATALGNLSPGDGYKQREWYGPNEAQVSCFCMYLMR